MSRTTWFEAERVDRFEMRHVNKFNLDKGVHIDIVYEDGTRFEKVGFGNAIKGKDNATPTERYKDVMRRTVYYQSTAWKVIADHDCCQKCGTTTHLQVDHTRALKWILLDFEKEHPRPHDSFTYVRNEIGAHEFSPAEIKYAEAWKIFHESAVEFQYLCRSCNASKGAR
jgi:hypothetical protein